MFKSFTITSFILKKIENLNVYLFHNKKLSALRGSRCMGFELMIFKPIFTCCLY